MLQKTAFSFSRSAGAIFIKKLKISLTLDLNQLTLKCTTRQGSFSISQFLELGIALIDDKCHFATSCARSCQYQCVCKSFSECSKQFMSYGNFSLNVWRRNLHTLLRGTNSFTNSLRAIIGHTPSASLSLDFLRVVQYLNCLELTYLFLTLLRYLVLTTSSESKSDLSKRLY